MASEKRTKGAGGMSPVEGSLLEGSGRVVGSGGVGSSGGVG